jgi:hypothetical protein
MELALLFDIGLVRAVDHDIGDVRIAEQLFERTEAEQLVDQHFFQRKLFAPVEREFQFGQHFDDDRAEFFGQLVLGQRGGGFRIDALEQAGKHLFLDLVDRSFEMVRIHAILQPRHRLGIPGLLGRGFGSV